MTRLGLLIDPLDVLFFRDGRPFGPSAAGTSGLPTPQTLGGAIRALLLDCVGCDFPALHRQVRAGSSVMEAMRSASRQPWVADVRLRGPWLAQLEGAAPAPVVPAPAILRRSKRSLDAGIERLRPLPRALAAQLVGARPPAPLQRALWQFSPEVTEPVGGFVTLAGMRQFLDGGVPSPEHLVPAAALFGYDRRVGVGIDRDAGAAEEGLLYAATFLALRPGVQLYAELDADDDARALLDGALLRFGGEGRRATLRVVRPVSWPEHTDATRGAVLVLTTPGLFANGWCPAALATSVIASSVPGALPISGWNMATGGPKPSRFAATAGSTYFITAGAAVPASLSDAEPDAADGWGCFLKGTFDDE